MTSNSSFVDALARTEFARRHIGPVGRGPAEMLDVIGVASVDELIEETVPGSIRQRSPLDLGRRCRKPRVLQKLRAIARKNKMLTLDDRPRLLRHDHCLP